MLTYQDVFVPGGLPLHTYNPRADLQLEDRLAEAKRNLSKLVTVTGQTKSGKTVLARKVFPKKGSIWIDGGLVRTEDDFWHSVVDQLGLFGQIQEGDTSDVTSTINGRGIGGCELLSRQGNRQAGSWPRLKTRAIWHENALFACTHRRRTRTP